MKAVLARVVGLARQQRVVRGQRLRVDTTVVETNIHYPTDSTLLADGVRVLTRTMRQLGERVRNRTRSVARRVFEIAQRSRTTGNRARQAVRDESQARMKGLYRGLMRIARRVVRDAHAVAARLPARPRPRMRRLAERLHGDDRNPAPRGGPDPRPGLARRHAPSGQSRQRVRAAHADHPQGKLAKPTEFGCVVKIQEAEGQVITDYVVCAPGQSDRDLWVPSLEQHAALFGHPPQLAVADGGFASRTNERWAQAHGVRHVVLPRRQNERRSRAARAALRWRTGSEGRISALKRCHGLRRCRYRGRPACSAGSGSGSLPTT